MKKEKVFEILEEWEELKHESHQVVIDVKEDMNAFRIIWGSGFSCFDPYFHQKDKKGKIQVYAVNGIILRKLKKAGIKFKMWKGVKNENCQ